MEPKPLFGNTSSPASSNGRGSEPRPLSFDSETSEVPARTEFPREPGALDFSSMPSVPAEPASSSTADSSAPGALVFAEGPVVPVCSPKALPGALDFSSVPGSAEETSSPTAGGIIPKALTLPDLPAVPAPIRAAQAVFEEERHPAQGAAEAAARKLEPSLFDANEPRIRRLIAQLLPLTMQKLQDFADPTLRSAQQLTHEVAGITTQFAKLDASAVLEEAVQACSLKTGLMDKLRARFSNQGEVGPRVEALGKNLNALSETVGNALPRSDEHAQGLVLHLVALRAIEQVAGASDSSSELKMLHQRLDLLRAAGQQAQLVSAQLRQLQITLGTLENQCEHLLTVTLSAVALAKAGVRPA